MKIPLLFLSMIALLVVPLAAAEFVPTQVPPSTNWLAHADFDALRTSETGKEVFAGIQREHPRRLAELEHTFGLQPLRDVAGVTIFGDGEVGHAVALIDGIFDRGHLEEVFRGATNYLAGSHAGFTIHSWEDQGVRQYASFASNTLLVFSRQEAGLVAALDVLAASAPVPLDPFFATGVGRPLVLARANLGKMARPQSAENAKMLDLISVMQMAASEEHGRFALRMAATTPTVEDANRLRLMANGMLLLAQTANPRFQGLNLTTEMTSSENPPSVAVTLSMPLADWLILLSKAMAPPDR